MAQDKPTPKGEVNVHAGHRSRLRHQFLEHGGDALEDYKILEILLFYVNPRGDMNGLAHTLLNHFGTLSAVFDAHPDALLKIPGVGEKTAALIKLIPQICARYQSDRTSLHNIINTPEDAARVLMPKLRAERDEVVWILCLDGKRKLLQSRLLLRGDVTSANVSIRKIAETALACNATGVILAHNHISGIAVPSTADRLATARIAEALRAVDITLIDHIIAADDDFVSMADSKMLD